MVDTLNKASKIETSLKTDALEGAYLMLVSICFFLSFNKYLLYARHHIMSMGYISKTKMYTFVGFCFSGRYQQ